MRGGDPNGSFLRFRVGDCDLSLEVAEVDEVIRLGEMSEFGRRVPGVDGAIPLHGQVVPVLHLSRLLQIESGEPPLGVVATGRGHRVALGVDEVLGLYESPPIASEEEPLPGLGERGVRQIHRLDGEIICCLDLDRIFPEESWEAIRSLADMETDGLLGDTTLGILGY